MVHQPDQRMLNPVLPSICCVCARPATSAEPTISYSKTDNYILFRVTRSYSAHVPVCQTCQRKLLSYSRASGKLILVPTCILGLPALIYALAAAMDINGIFLLTAVTSVVGFLAGLLLSKLFNKNERIQLGDLKQDGYTFHNEAFCAAFASLNPQIPVRFVPLPRKGDTRAPNTPENQRRVAAEHFGAVLRDHWATEFDKVLSDFRGMTASQGIRWDDVVLQNEVGALLYFAYDFAIASGDEKALRNHIADGFRYAAPMPLDVAGQVAPRLEAYASAIRDSSDLKQGLINVGKVFAASTGNALDGFVIMNAAMHFTNHYNLVVELVGKSLATIG